eukprot:TRINITY_DN8358_c0_g1_i1.p1 TRINITY_DN8358_c0_g1~~TRINITY_DN8358_c0_g1_i1.p1  ORF type:complete len:168 (-),score=15.22 TRINITY_DN8358_c0_g1_i1:120-623(-)
MGILKDTTKMKSTLISGLFVLVAALSNANDFIVETYDKNDDNLNNMINSDNEITNRASVVISPCLEPPGVKGPAKKRWTFSPRKGCHAFIWGGNRKKTNSRNRFKTKDQCEKRCLRKGENNKRLLEQYNCKGKRDGTMCYCRARIMTCTPAGGARCKQGRCEQGRFE